jgi:ADP-dependent NAD(P)H-hydrate dehydratase / NAD(P)H-hydrate epimerase
VRPVWTAAQARAADAAAQQRVSEATLITRAATAVAGECRRLLGGAYGRRVVVVAGPGHNGADALEAGVRLRERGAWVDIVLPAGPPRDAHGATPLATLAAGGARVVEPAGAGALLARADLVVDGLLGVGARADRPLPWPELGAALAGCAAAVVAVDLPSGVDADTGAAAAGAPRADLTVTFGALKVGLLVGEGRELAGTVVVADIGLGAANGGVSVVDADDVAPLVPVAGAEATKYRRGVVGVVGGGAGYVGAPVLACAGALHAGAGTVRLHSVGLAADTVRRLHPEVVAVVHDADAVGGLAAAAGADVTGDAKVDAWVVGPGLGVDDGARAVVQAVLADDRPAVVDADALTIAARDPGLLRRSAPTILTPHTGEFERLTGMAPDQVAADRVGAARRAAERLGAHVVLKGPGTVVAAPDGRALVDRAGTGVLAVAGTGDVLAGVVGALLAAAASHGGTDPDVALLAASGVWLHGLAGRLAAGDPPAPVLAGDLAAAVAEAVRVARASTGA